MGREFPGNTSPSSGTKGKALSTPTSMGSAMGSLTHGKEYGVGSVQMGPGTMAKTAKMPAPSLAPTPGKEYRQVSA